MSVDKESDHEEIDKSLEESPASSPEVQAPEPKTEYVCDICGQVKANQKGLSSHIHYKHRDKEVSAPFETAESEEVKLDRILAQAGIAKNQGRGLIVSSFANYGENTPQALYDVLSGMMISQAKIRMVLTNYFNRIWRNDLEKEVVLGDSKDIPKTTVQTKGPIQQQLDDMRAQRLLDAQIAMLEKQSGQGNDSLQQQRIAEDKERRESNERIERMRIEAEAKNMALTLQLEKERRESFENRLAAIQKENSENVQGLFASIQSNNEKQNKVFTDSLKLMQMENQHQRELEAMKTQLVSASNAGERPIISIGKELNRTIRELPTTITTAFKQIYPSGIPQVPTMTQEQMLESAKRLQQQQLAQQPQQEQPPQGYV
ncbi:MAG TPA: hypothetical protein VNE86_04195 [Nitrososphaerales archaeon]|nr:hypothetical protein [Nitrososphaerales archaeon]